MTVYSYIPILYNDMYTLMCMCVMYIISVMVCNLNILLLGVKAQTCQLT